MASGRSVMRVPTYPIATARRGSREPSMSDPIDALAVAQAALREAGLPTARLDGATREVKLLTDHRQHLMAQCAELVNRLRGHLHELDPPLQVPSRTLRCYRVMNELAQNLAGLDDVVARIASELVTRCRELTVQINDLERELPGRARPGSELRAIPGCGVLRAAIFLGETAGGSRFRSAASPSRRRVRTPVDLPGNGGDELLVRGLQDPQALPIPSASDRPSFSTGCVQRGRHRQVGVDRVDLALAAAFGAVGSFAFDHGQTRLAQGRATPTP